MRLAVGYIFFYSLCFVERKPVFAHDDAWEHPLSEHIFVTVAQTCLLLHCRNWVIYFGFAAAWVQTLDLIDAETHFHKNAQLHNDFSFSFHCSSPAPLPQHRCPLSLNCDAMFNNCVLGQGIQFFMAEKCNYWKGLPMFLSFINHRQHVIASGISVT